VPPSPTDDEELTTKPAAQVAYRAAYPSGYGPARVVERLYDRNRQRYRDLYHRLHVEVDGHLDVVRRTVTDGGSQEAVIVRTSDHGELLGSHGGLHQKWFTLYDEATRVPLSIVRIGERTTAARTASPQPTSHVDLLPTLLAAAGADVDRLAAELARDFTEVHPLPGRDLMPVVDGGEEPDPAHTIYVQTRDNVFEGDSESSAVARRLGRGDRPPAPLRIRVPAHVGANVEGIVGRVEEGDATGGAGRLWKLVRTFDDPATWTEPGVRHLAADGPAGRRYRSEPLADQWELYDLDADPAESDNRVGDPRASEVLAELRGRLQEQRRLVVPARNRPWPYRRRRPLRHAAVSPRPPARLARRGLQRLGLHPVDTGARTTPELTGRRALVVCTNHGVLDVGKPTGVFASEMTAPVYVMADAGMRVDVASPRGGTIPVDPLSLRGAVRCAYDDRFLKDHELRAAVGDSLAVGEIDVADYDLVYLAGGWGAAFDFATSEELAAVVTRADRLGLAIGGVCHGPLGLLGATTADGRPLVEGRRLTAVTDKQVRELGISSTPWHPEAELRTLGARFEARHRLRDVLANHWVLDGNLVTGQNQNAAPMVARELVQLVARS
jgi:putative intracellular protease/amidase